MEINIVFITQQYCALQSVELLRVCVTVQYCELDSFEAILDCGTLKYCTLQKVKIIGGYVQYILKKKQA